MIKKISDCHSYFLAHSSPEVKKTVGILSACAFAVTYVNTYNGNNFSVKEVKPFLISTVCSSLVYLISVTFFVFYSRIKENINQEIRQKQEFALLSSQTATYERCFQKMQNLLTAIQEIRAATLQNRPIANIEHLLPEPEENYPAIQQTTSKIRALLLERTRLSGNLEGLMESIKEDDFPEEGEEKASPLLDLFIGHEMANILQNNNNLSFEQRHKALLGILKAIKTIL